jgi:two-component system NtrC family sensor kinase
MAAIAEPTHIESRPQSATTLGTVVELVRRITQSDVASIVTFSLQDRMLTWRAVSGFQSHVVDEGNPIRGELTNEIAIRGMESNETVVLENIGERPDLPASDFPVHTAEGIRSLALTPLSGRSEMRGALIVAYRAPHSFSNEEKQLLEGLAAIASLALDNARLSETIGEAESIWKQTFDAIREGIFVYDSRGRIMHANTYAAEMLDLDSIKVVSLSFSEAFARMFGKRAAEYYLADNYGASTVVEVQTEDGRRYLVSIFTVHKSDGTVVSVSTWNDVTRLSEMQDQLGRSRRLASVGQLAAGVAHEVNNPLAAITTCAEAIIRDMRQQPADALPPGTQWTYYLEEIVRQALRCKEITRGLLDLTRQRQAKRVLADVNAIAKECSKVAVQRANSTAHLEMKLDDAIPQVATDTEMVRQILDNFLMNAVDALSDDGGIVTVSTNRLGDRIAIEVADTGSGIPPELLSQIFDPFFSTKGPGKGYGLGLAISLTLAETLGGGISVESKVGKGSRFRLWLPRRAPE